MTRTVVAVTTYRLRVTCDKCGLALYTWRAAGKGWVVVEGKDLCPGCKTKDRVDDFIDSNY